MKAIHIILRSSCLFVLMVSALSASSPAVAQDTNGVPDMGRVYLTLDPDTEVRDVQVAAREPFTFYLILDLEEIPGYNPPIYCGAFGGQLRFAPEMFLSSIQWISDLTLDFGQGLSPGVYDFFFGILDQQETTIRVGLNVIGTFEAVLIEEVSDVLVEVGRSDTVGKYDHFVFTAWTATEGQDEAPDFEAPFDPSTGGLKINSTGLASDSQSWGKVKALYRR